MMYRSRWASRHNQKVILGVWIQRSFFEKILRAAKPTQGSKDHDEQARNTPCRLQWDPDHLPDGSPHVARRAIQIGIKGPLAHEYASVDRSVSPILGIVDATPFATEQRRVLDGMKRAARAQPASSDLQVARERIYLGLPSALADAIGVSAGE